MKNTNSNVEIVLNPALRFQPVKRRILEYSCILVVSIIILLLFSFWTSPLYRYWYGCDSCFFSMVGRGILEGKIMYRDFYDLKGPYFFFLQALSQIIFKARLGSFLMEIPFLAASAILIYEISQLFVSKAKSVFILVIFYFCEITTLWGGNTLEEYALPLSLLCLYLILKDLVAYKRPLAKIPVAHSVIMGACLGIFTLSKISVCAPVLGIVAAIIFILLFSKQFKAVFRFVVYILAGFTLAVAPIILYYSIQGCLSEMLHCVFEIGLSRSLDFGEQFNIKWELKSSGCIFAFVFAATHMKRIGKEISAILMAMSAATYLLLHLGTPFYYYFITMYPCLILALALFLKTYNPLIIFENIKQAVCILLFTIMLFYYVDAAGDSLYTAVYDYQQSHFDEYENDAKALASLIPEFERDSVFSFQIDMTWFECNQITPCCKYVVNLPFFLCLDPPIQDDILNTLKNNPPKWLVIGDDFSENMPEIATYVMGNYECICENSSGKLFLHSEN